jgi:hypothetical protein
MSRPEMEAETVLAPILTAASSGTLSRHTSFAVESTVSGGRSNLRSAVLERPRGFSGYTSVR